MTLDRSPPPVRAWFEATFAAPTPAQGRLAGDRRGRPHLLLAPTGSGKTLAAFLWAIDRLTTEAAAGEPRQRTRVLYISPLRALAVDVEKNLRAPLAGIGSRPSALGDAARHVPTVGDAHRRHAGQGAAHAAQAGRPTS